MKKRYFGTVYRDTRADGSLRGWAVRWTDADGRRGHRRGFESRREAEDFLQEQKRLLDLARARRGGPAPDGLRPLHELEDRILDAWSSSVRPVTLRGRRIQLRHWSAWLGDMPLSSVTKEVIQAEIDRMVKGRAFGGRGLAPQSARLQVKTLSGAFRILRGLGLRLESPFEDLRLPAVEQRGRRMLTVAELRSLVAATPPEERAAVTFLVETGARPSELRGLRWGEVATDLQSVQLYRTKTYKPRTLPLSAAAADVLRHRRAALPEAPASEDLVFPMGYARLLGAVKAAARAAGLGALTPYDLRHAFAADLVSRGTHIEDVAAVMGHSNIRTTHTYTRWAGGGAPERVRQVLDGRRQGLPGEPPPGGEPTPPPAA